MLTLWQKFVASFHSSETIIWARIKTAVGGLFFVLQTSGADLSVFFDNPKYYTALQIGMAFLAFDGLTSEVARRHREDWKEPETPDVPDVPDPGAKFKRRAD